MSNKIKYSTERNGEFKEFPLNSTTLIMPDDAEFMIRYDQINKALEIVKVYGANDESTIQIIPCVSNKILLK
jgi:hypothetical protein